MGKINVDVNVNDNWAPRCRQSTLAQTSEMQARLRFLSESSQASKTKSLTSALTLALKRLLHYRTPDGRYLVTRKVHWQAVYRVLVDEGWYDASLGYAGFVDYIRSVAPPGGFRIMPDVETIRHISQTLYARPFRDWRYDAAYGTKRWAYERMRAVATTLLGAMGEMEEMVNETVRNGYLDEPT